MAFDMTPEELEREIRDTDGVEVALGGKTTWGHLDSEGVDLLDEGGGVVVATRKTIRVVTGLLGGLEQNAYLEIIGVRHRAHDVRLVDDGAITEVEIVRAD